MGRVVMVLAAAGVVALLVRMARRRHVEGEPLSRLLGAVSWVPFVGVFVLVVGFPPPASEAAAGRTSPGLLGQAAPTNWQTWTIYALLLVGLGLVVAMGLAYRREVFLEARQARLAGEAPEPWFWPAGLVAALWFGGGLVLFMTVISALAFLEERVYGPVMKSVPDSYVDAVAAQSGVAVLVGVMFFFGVLPFGAAGIAYLVQRSRISWKMRAFEELDVGIQRRVASAVEEARDRSTSPRRGVVTPRPTLALTAEEHTRLSRGEGVDGG